MALDAIRIGVKGVKQLAAHFEKLPDELREEFGTTVTDVIGKIKRLAVRKASGEVVKIKTGRYVRAIKSSVSNAKTRVRGQVYSRDPRVGLFEFGGRTKPRTITAKNVSALHFLRGSGEVFARVVRHPGGKYPKRSVLQASLDDLNAEVIDELKKAVDAAVGRHNK